ncbi:group III truncated hemoglobin [Elizabethkingia meningoseptica]|uniref:group III truncated hemoglobin n=1 Tax=Elizabethkingia meningoseptica TaxID=238 RepID=UPI0023AF6C48|nr:group III truncated hemoglobin [Elizabethkingia meningoseptica]MDE5492554.1 group III truncated hemoglobin [Elizabethkingia meningoseptica]
MKDIESHKDVEKLVNTFYEGVRANKTIGYIFNDIAKVDWEHHLPRMYSFWETILFGKENFKGNPMIKHILLSKQTELNKIHFDTWLAIWHTTIDKNFSGLKAEEAKQKAANIARIMLHKIQENG